MSRVFWALLAVNAVLAVLLFFALPFGPDLVYAAQAGSMIGAVALAGRASLR